MRGMQKIIVRWMRRQLDRRAWSAERWAREAGLAATTVTRAMSDTYPSVSSVPTLHALAKAAGVPSVLDFLDGQANLPFTYPVLSAILAELLPVVGCNLEGARIEALAHAIVDVLVGLSVQDGEASDPHMARALAKAARATLFPKD